MAAEAQRYLEGFRWCGSVRASYMGIAIPGVVGVFLHEIRPKTADADEWVWTVTGDLPPAYIATEDAPTAAAALEGYVGEMRRWVEAVNLGQSIDDLIPVNAPASPEYAAKLESRLAFLEEEVIPEYEDEERDS
jgi:hypothetical protein